MVVCPQCRGSDVIVSRWGRYLCRQCGAQWKR